MTTDDEEDVPLRVDFRDPGNREDLGRGDADQEAVPAELLRRVLHRPCRRDRGFASSSSAPVRASSRARFLLHCDVHTYVALDWSQAMHDIAAEHLGELASRVTFVLRDFRAPTWPTDLGTFDAIVTMQAAHETRHKRHVVPLLERARTLLAPGGLLLYCDGYLHADHGLPALAFERADQPRALERAGYVDVRLLHDGRHPRRCTSVEPHARRNARVYVT